MKPSTPDGPSDTSRAAVRTRCRIDGRHMAFPDRGRELTPMRGKRTTTGAAVLVGALAVTGLAFAPTAAAVTPTTATINASCGLFGGGAATLTATQSGTS